jgi:hypothetical protein
LDRDTQPPKRPHPDGLPGRRSAGSRLAFEGTAIFQDRLSWERPDSNYFPSFEEPTRGSNDGETDLLQHCKLKFVAQTQKVDFKPEMKEMVFSVGMIILAVNRGDLELFSQIIANRKKNG